MDYFQAQNFMKETYPEEVYTEIIDDECVKTSRIEFQENELFERAFLHLKMIKYQFANGTIVKLPISNHVIHKPIKEYLSEQQNKKINVDKNRLLELKMLERVKAEGIENSHTQQSTLIKENLGKKYERSIAEIETLLAKVNMVEKDYQAFKEKLQRTTQV